MLSIIASITIRQIQTIIKINQNILYQFKNMAISSLIEI